MTEHVHIVCYNNKEAQTVDDYFSKEYKWDKQVEVSDLGMSKILQGQLDFPMPSAGIRGLNILLDMEHWVKEIDNYITPLNYNSTLGELELQTNQLFIEWRKGMERFATEPKKDMFAKRGSGYAIMQLFPTMIQFREGEIKRSKISGSTYWKGLNVDSGGEKSINKKMIE